MSVARMRALSTTAADRLNMFRKRRNARRSHAVCANTMDGEDEMDEVAFHQRNHVT